MTWEWAGDHARREDKVAAIFDSRFPAQRIREFVESIYLSEQSLVNRMLYVQHKGLNPDPAGFDKLNGVPWLGPVHCGHNPFLVARS